MTVIVPILNTKGGVGKTTTAICLATALAGTHTVEVWDADPQGSATEWAQMAASIDDPLPFNIEVINKILLQRLVQSRSEERRVGKECRKQRAQRDENKNGKE